MNATTEPPSRLPSGYISDTKSEENGWNSNVLSLGAAWMPQHSNASTWLVAAKRYLANTYTVADTNPNPLAGWISTVTLYPSYALENHGFFHPIYQMVGGMSLGDSFLMARLANPVVAEALRPFAEHNVRTVWTRVLAPLMLDSGDFAYPAGLDWELRDFEHKSYLAWLATHFDEPLARWAHEQVARMVRHRQQINGDGSFVGPSSGGFYREAVEARRAAIAWLHSQSGQFPSGPVEPPGPAFLHLPEVHVLHQRSGRGSFSLSYKSGRVMAVVEAKARRIPDQAFLTTPRLPGLIGLGGLGPPTEARLLSLTNFPEGLEATFAFTNGNTGWTYAQMRWDGESFALIEVPYPWTTPTAVDTASFVTGIQNDPLTGGVLGLRWGETLRWITNRSGVTVHVTNNWVCVGDWMGMVAGPAGRFEYLAADRYNILGAAEDRLQFVPAFPTGPRYAIWLPACPASEMVSLAPQIEWTHADGGVRLRWPNRKGELQTLSAPVPTAGYYVPYLVRPSRGRASSTQGNYTFDRVLDGRTDTFWVSLHGPTNRAEWLWLEWDRPVALAEAVLLPRTENGGYGPSVARLIANLPGPPLAGHVPAPAQTLYEGSVPPTSPLRVWLSTPVTTSNALWIFFGAYDRGLTNQPRNVQVVEVQFWERARPGTYGDWVLRTWATGADGTVVSPAADPDRDGAPNLWEFIVGTNPANPQQLGLGWEFGHAGELEVRWSYRRRTDIVGVQETFLASTNLTDWIAIQPSWVRLREVVAGLGRYELAFSIESKQRFYRLQYRLLSDR
ncbi:MAG: hypothetical protein RMN51_02205 [Verrucomicrobiota bacterium]|nr:hypothetical protein [Limisphaera sp.]MDW8380908.1 hypothetical protein [Verrucomicrobiota bacterium]